MNETPRVNSDTGESIDIDDFFQILKNKKSSHLIIKTASGEKKCNIKLTMRGNSNLCLKQPLYIASTLLISQLIMFCLNDPSIKHRLDCTVFFRI